MQNYFLLGATSCSSHCRKRECSVYIHMQGAVLRWHGSGLMHPAIYIQSNRLCKNATVQNFMFLFLLMNKFPEIKTKISTVEDVHAFLTVFSVINTICYSSLNYMQSSTVWANISLLSLDTRPSIFTADAVIISIFRADARLLFSIQIFHPPMYFARHVPPLILCH